jgi:serine protease Do
MTMKNVNVLFLIIFISGLFYFNTNHTNANNQKPELAKITKPEKITNFVYAAEQSLDAVVHIKSKIVENNIYRYYDPLSEFFSGNGYKYFNQPRQKTASGSGVIISNDGYIVTNNHVINDATEIEVVLNDKTVYEAEILGVDPTTDLALLKINTENIHSINFANSDDIKVGEWVIAVGNPFNLNSTVTAGIISAKGRAINLLQNRNSIESFIQTDAAINPGNSGGALVNIEGNLIGINTAIHSNTGSYTGYGFAIPSNMVKKIITDLKEYGEVKRAFIGIQITEINPDISKRLNLKNNKGVLITKVFEEGAAYKSGIKIHDVIISIENKEINSVADLQEQISNYSPGEIIKCTIKRKNNIKSFQLDLTN